MNDEAIKKLLNIYSELETKLLDEIVEHFKINEEFINSDFWRVTKLEELGVLNNNIIKYIAEVTNRTPKEIEEALRMVGYEALNINRLNEAYKDGLLKTNPSILIENQVIENLINYSYNELTNRFLEISNKIEQGAREAYLNVVEKAYIQTSEGITYQEAIRNSLLELGDKGITTLIYRTIDDDGNVVGIRNYDVEGAVRRELVTATHNLTNNINQAVAEELGVEYLYLSEHIRCRPQHFPWQGTIIKREDLVKVTRLGEVDGMGGPNCKHYPTPYFGTARGKELKRISVEEATEQYDLSQKQRYLERGIRKWKRKQRLFKTADDKEYYKKCKDKVKEWQLRNKEFTEKNNLRRDFSRENVERVNTNFSQNNYEDITDSIINSKPQNYNVEERTYFIDENNIKYNVDGKNVLLKTSQKEKDVANVLGRLFGGKIELVPVVLNPKGIKTPDYLINGIKYDLKEPRGSSKTTIYDLFKHKNRQADNFIVDIHKSGLNKQESIKQTEEIFSSKHRKWIKTIILMNNNEVFKILKRK